MARMEVLKVAFFWGGRRLLLGLGFWAGAGGVSWEDFFVGIWAWDVWFSSQTEVFGKISCSDSAFPKMIFWVPFIFSKGCNRWHLWSHKTLLFVDQRTTPKVCELIICKRRSNHCEGNFQVGYVCLPEECTVKAKMIKDETTFLLERTRSICDLWLAFWNTGLV